eukprot:1195158-Prorocentrum_minimum.AAC.1
MQVLRQRVFPVVIHAVELSSITQYHNSSLIPPRVIESYTINSFIMCRAGATTSRAPHAKILGMNLALQSVAPAFGHREQLTLGAPLEGIKVKSECPQIDLGSNGRIATLLGPVAHAHRPVRPTRANARSPSDMQYVRASLSPLGDRILGDRILGDRLLGGRLGGLGLSSLGLSRLVGHLVIIDDVTHQLQGH